MPLSLREQAELAARASGRSLNSELVTRLEASFLSGDASGNLIPATRAKELALMARSGLPMEVRRRAIEAIARAVRLGHREVVVDLADLHLDLGISDAELNDLFNAMLDELKHAGYNVKWGGISSLWIDF